MYHEAIPVELIVGRNTIKPDPSYDEKWDELYKLRWLLGCRIAYLKHYCGPVEIPEVKIATKDSDLWGTIDPVPEYAVMLNNSGHYRTYGETWGYITHIFDGMRAVYNIKKYDIKGEIPFLFDFNFEKLPKGHAQIKRGHETTELLIRINEPMPLNMFNGLIGVSFAYVGPANKVN